MITLSRVLLILTGILLWTGEDIRSQSITNYNFSSSSGSFSALSGGTTMALSGGTVDDGYFNNIPIGFTFYYMGNSYTTLSASTNGFVVLGQALSGAITTNDLNNSGGGNAPRPILAPLWDDLDLQANTNFSYSTSGSAPNRVFTAEWLNLQWNFSATGNTISIQIILEEATSSVKFVYRDEGGTVNSGSASVGITGGSGSAVSGTVEMLSLNSLGVSPTASSVTETETINTKPATGQTYTFTPAYSVTPAAPITITFSGVTGTGMTVNWVDNSSNETFFQVYRSTSSGGPYSIVDTVNSTSTGTTGTSYNSVQTGLVWNTTYYYRIVACNEGSAYSANLEGSQSTSSGSISGVKTIGASGDYTSLTDAFADITANGLGGAVQLELLSDYNSGSETFPITISFITNSANEITVRPEAGATGLVITSSNTTATIDLNGCQYITFDGRPGGSGTNKELTIINTSTGAAIRFINDAISNTITYVNVSGTANTSSSSGVIFFSTTTGAYGNDNNTISYCDINAQGSAVGIQSLGTASKLNSGNQILNNTIRDFYISNTSTTSTYGIRIQSNSTDWTISNNSFYQSSARAYSTTSAIHYMLSIGTGTSSGGYVISGNYFGGSAANASGTYTISSGQARLFVIDASVGTSSATSIQGNTITNIACSTAYTSTSSSGFIGMNLSAGSFNVGTVTGNTIGSTSATDKIRLHITGSTGPLFVGINCATTSGTTVIQNNSIGGMTATTTTATAYLSLYPISLSGSGHSVTITGNTIGSTTVANSIYNNTGSTSTATYQTRGMNITSTGIITVTNNTVANITASGTGTGTTLAGIYMVAAPASTGWTVTGNTISNLTNSSSSTTFGSATQALSGLVFSGSALHTISGNTVHTLINNAASANVSVVGIYFSGSASLQSILEKNFVHSLRTSSSYNYARITGIMIAGGLHLLRNNMIRLGIDESGNSLTTAHNYNGIWKTVATVGNFFHNSIYIGGTGVGAHPVKTFAFRKHGTSGADSLMNNIFWNARSNATSGNGKHYAIGVNQSSGLISNYNIFYANGTDGTLGTRDTGSTTNYTSLANLQSGFGGTDANSMVAPPNFTTPNGSSSTVNLHISDPTVVEGTGIALSNVTDDFDGQSRSGLTPTDIGADAGDFVAADLSAPTISYTTLTNTSSTGDRTLTATITDASGVPTSGSLVPRVYFKKNSGSYSSAAGTLTSGTSTNGTWSFTISAVTMGSVTAGDVISYFIVAQDVASTANLGSSPSGAAGTDVTNISTYPSSPSQYLVVGSISGNFFIGGTGNVPSPGCTYVDLTAAFADINNVVTNITVTAGGSGYTTAPTVVITGSGTGATATANLTGDAVSSVTITNPGTGYLTPPTISFTGGGGTGAAATATVSAGKEVTGPVEFILTNTYNASEENYFPVTLNRVAGVSATNTITIKPDAGVNATITGNSSTSVIKLSDVSYVTIDGSNNGSTSRNLSITNSSTSANTGVIWLSSLGAGQGSNNNIIKNCNISAGINQSTSTNFTWGIYSGGTILSTATGGADNDNNTYQNNYITKTRVAINLVGTSTTNPNNGNIVKENVIGPDEGFGSNQIGACGILIMNQEDIQITQNKIRYVGGPYSLTPSGSGTDRTGIAIGSTTSVAGATVNSTQYVKNAVITRNYIHDIIDERTYSASGIVLAGADGSNSTNNTVANNVIFRVRSNGTSTDQTHGITIVGGKDDKVFYNSIYLTGDVDSSSITTSTSSTFGIAVTNTSPVNLVIKNNAIHNNLYSSKSAVTLKNAAISIPTSFSWGTGGSNYNGLYRLVDSSRQNTGNIGAALAGGTFYAGLSDWQTASSQDANSVSGNPLFNSTINLQPGVGSALIAAGTPISGITIDYLGVTRSASTPTIGAYEESGDFVPPTISYTTLGNTAFTTNRTLSGVSITDASGVNTTSAKPRLYFKKSTDANAFVGNTSTDNGWKWVEGTVSESTFSFTTDYSIINGGSVSQGDTIQYFVVAQDNASTPNVGSSPSTGFSGTSVSSITSAPTSPNSYRILQSLSGTKTVGSGGDYASLTNTGGLFEDINSKILTGNLTVNILNDLSGETGTVALNPIAVEPANSLFTVTISPADATGKIIVGSSSNELIKINGADRVIIDGSFAGAGQYLTFRNTSTGGSVITFINDAVACSVKNTILEGAVTSGLKGVILFSTGLSTGNDSIVIYNNVIRDRSDSTGVPSNLLYSAGSSASISNSENKILNNSFLNFTSNGISLVSTNSSNYNWTIEGNTISQDTAVARSSELRGMNINVLGNNNTISNNIIWGLKTSGATTGILLDDVGTIVVSKNKIYGLKSTPASTSVIYGINAYGGSNSDYYIVNNMISIIPDYANNQSIWGIYDWANSGDSVYSYYNTVYVGGQAGGTTTTSAYNKNSTSYYSKVLNNLLVNVRTGSAAHYAARVSGSSTTNNVFDHNVYVSVGANDTSLLLNSSTAVSFATWRTLLSTNVRDRHSFAHHYEDVAFASLFMDSVSNLLVNNAHAVCWIANGKGRALNGYVDDFAASNVRSQTFGFATDAGCDEFTTTTTPPVSTPSALPAPGTTTTYSNGGTTLGSIAWGGSGTPPSQLHFTYVPGVTPNYGTGSFSNCHWKLIPELASLQPEAFSYDVTFNYNEDLLGQIDFESDIRLAKSDDQVSWDVYFVSGTGAGQYQLDTVNNTITVYGLSSFSEFTLTDLDNPLPVELTAFTAKVKGRDITLSWNTASEVNSLSFEIERKLKDSQADWKTVSTIQASGNSNSPKDYSYTDKKLNSGKYLYRLKMIDNDGTYTYSNETEAEIELPKEFMLSQNYPNPFNPTTKIDYQLPHDARVTLELYNISGERVALLVNEEQPGGYYTYQLNTGSLGVNLASGVYIYRLIAQGQQGDTRFMNIKKLMILK